MLRGLYLDAGSPDGNGGNTPPTPPDDEKPPEGEPTPIWEEWLKGQPEAVQKMYQEHTHGLKSALDKTRDENKDLQKQLKAIGAKLEEGSEARKQVDALAAQLEEASNRADFYEEAIKAGVSNPRLAWLAVSSATDEFTKRGKVDFDALKEANPELFAPKSTPRGNAGSGTQSPPPEGKDMNKAIRQMAGRES